jgi:hypothetical protein
MRSLNLAFLAFAFCACTDDPDHPDPLVPVDPAPPEADPPEPPPPEAGGEYAIRVETTFFDCLNSDPEPVAPFYAVADVVPQDPWTIDLVSELQGSFVEFDRTDLKRAADGSFDDHWKGYAAFWDILLTVYRDIEESAADGRSLSFDHRFDVGWDDDQDVYHSECLYEAEISGSLLHERWDGSGRDGVTGQWWTRREVLASPVQYARRVGPDALPKAFDGTRLDPQALPAGSIVMSRGRRGGPIAIAIVGTVPKPLYRKVASRLESLAAIADESPLTAWPKAPRADDEDEDPAEAEAMLMETEAEAPLFAHRISVVTLSQSPNDDVVDIRGLFRSLERVYRDPQTGAVDAWMLIIAPYLDSDGRLRTMLQETALTGTVLPVSLELDETWRWWTAATETLPEVEHWFQHERYSGAPRHMPHARSQPEPPHGTYAARYDMTANDCGYQPYAENRFLRILPTGGGTVWPRITGYDREPIVTPGPDGSFSAPFTRLTTFWRYEYAITGWLIDGHAVDIRMQVERYDRATDAYDCSATFEVAGEKAFMTARPAE